MKWCQSLFFEPSQQRIAGGRRKIVTVTILPKSGTVAIFARTSAAVLAERVGERPGGLVGREVDGIVDPVRFGMDGDRRMAVGARLEADPFVGLAAFGAVDVGDVDLDVGQALLEPLELAPHPLLEP